MVAATRVKDENTGRAVWLRMGFTFAPVGAAVYVRIRKGTLIGLVDVCIGGKLALVSYDEQRIYRLDAYHKLPSTSWLIKALKEAGYHVITGRNGHKNPPTNDDTQRSAVL